MLFWTYSDVRRGRSLGRAVTAACIFAGMSLTGFVGETAASESIFSRQPEGTSEFCIASAVPVAADGRAAVSAPSAIDRLPSGTFAVTLSEADDRIFAAVSIEDFKKLGFEYGDCVDICFSNGFTLRSVPFFSGQYTRIGKPMLYGYPNFKQIVISDNGGTLLRNAAVSNGDTVTISLVKKKAFLSIQQAFFKNYTADRADYASEMQFVNFRPVTGGKLRKGLIYRGASPIDSYKKRPEPCSRLLEQNGIRCVIDLSDTREKVQKCLADIGDDVSYFRSLYKNGKVACLGMDPYYLTKPDLFAHQLAEGLRFMLRNEGPYYIHCVEGKDRTGFVCMILEALAGAGYDEMLRDYMTTYANYFGYTAEKTPEAYAAIREVLFGDFMLFLHGPVPNEDYSDVDFRPDARKYLKSGGMTDAEIDALIRLISC